jgi:hypothetical protein
VRHRAGAVAGLLFLARPQDPVVGQVVQKDHQELARVLAGYQERNLAVAEERNLAVAEDLKALQKKALLLEGCCYPPFGRLRVSRGAYYLLPQQQPL